MTKVGRHPAPRGTLRVERETQCNIEMMWLIGRLMPDFKTIANFRKINAKHHLIVDFEVTQSGLDADQLAEMATRA